MPLTEGDVREILRLIDESDLDELRVESERFSLYVRRAGPAQAPVIEDELSTAGVATTDGEVHTIASPMLGIFYRAPAPTAAPFVDVGTRVAPETVVCLIEVMKMMNSVPAGVEGTIVGLCADNAELVEEGAPLFQVRPDR